MKEFVRLRVKTYVYLVDDDIEKKKQNKYIIKRMLRLIDYKNCLLNNKIILKSQ